MNVPGLRRLYWSLEKIIVPELRSSQYYYRDKLLSIVPVEKFRWLDLGCGHQVFADWMTAEEQELLGRTSFAVGLDLDFPSLKAHKGFQAKVCGNLAQIALRDSSFDVITANMVVEHLDQPAVVLGQVHRLLKAGGLFVFHTTNARNPFLRASAIIPQGLKNRIVYLLEHRKPEDIFPTHYRANRPEDIMALAESAGFEVCSLDLVSTSAFTQMLGPLVIVELLFIRLLRSPRLQHLRTNIVCVLRRKAGNPNR